MAWFFKKRTKDLIRHFTMEHIRMALLCPTSLVVPSIINYQENALCYHYTIIRQAIIKKTDNTKC